MFKWILKYKFIFGIMLIFVVITSLYSQLVAYTCGRCNGITIVLDAGHGGRDGGSVGVNGTIEKEINLDYVLTLKKKLVNLGYRVVLTRENDDGLYDEFAKNKKLSDLNKRMEIIKRANPNLVVSIHMNSFNDKSANGAVTYAKIDDEASETCANLIQQSILAENCNAKYKLSKGGDYFMLNCSYYTSVLIECGFISNASEEQMLNSDEYKDRFTTAITNGILLYFGNVSRA